MKTVALEKKLHIVEVHPSEVDGYKRDGWKLVKPAKAKPRTKKK